jgi:hypothetical protein
MAFYFHKGQERLQFLLKEDSKDFKGQLQIWRKWAVEGKIHFLKYNCKDLKVCGKTFYALSYSEYNAEGECCSSMDTLGLAIGELLDGSIYLFTDKKYRDRIYTYIMKGVQEIK